MLGDPSGQRESFPLVLEEFLNEAHQKGFSVLFYQIEREDMALYHDFGYNFFKLGEEAYVDLNTFTLTGKKKPAFGQSITALSGRSILSMWIIPHFLMRFWRS